MPNSLLKAPKKGFGISLREWFKDESFNSKLEMNLSKVKQILDNSAIENILKENNSGAKDNGNFIWGLIMLDKSLKL